MNDMLKNYSQEIGLYNVMTIEELIDSHRHLRELNKIRHEEWLKEVQKGYEAGIVRGESFAKEHGWISIERLKNMSITELVQFVGDVE